jgi:hypothetical protein
MVPLMMTCARMSIGIARFADFPSQVADTLTGPAPTTVTTPFDTVAAFASDEVQVASAVQSRAVPLASVAFAANVTRSPRSSACAGPFVIATAVTAVPPDPV